MIDSKLSPPAAAVAICERPRVGALLDQGFRHPLLIVRAPAGYGKTVAVADWLSRREVPVAWVSVDKGDNDPVRLWTHVAASMNRLSDGIGDESLRLLGRRVAAVHPAIDALAAELSRYGRRLALVFDDLDLIADADGARALDHALGVLPSNVCTIAVGRAMPPLATRRLRERGTVAEIGLTALAFTPEEGRSLFDDLYRLRLPVDQVDGLVQRAEGWAAGLRLAAIWLSRADDPSARADRFEGGHRWVMDYLLEQVLDGLDDELCRFLIGTSGLPRLHAGLCDMVLGTTDSARMLEEVEASGLFLAALDEERTWFRYHALFREALRTRLMASPYRVWAQLASRACMWFEDHGLIEEAIEQAASIGDHGRVAVMLGRYHNQLVREGRAATVARWIRALPAETLASHPRVVVAQLLATVGVNESAADRRRLLACAREARSDHPEHWTHYDEAALELMTSQTRDDDLASALRGGERALALARADARELVVPALGGLSFKAFLAGRDADARRWADQAVAQPRAAEYPFGHVTATVTQALLAVEHRDAALTRTLADAAHSKGRSAGITVSGTGARIAMAVGLAASLDGRLGDAQREVERALALNRIARGATRAWMLVTLADICRRRGDLRRAAQLAIRAGAVAGSCVDAGRVPGMITETIRMLRRDAEPIAVV